MNRSGASWKGGVMEKLKGRYNEWGYRKPLLSKGLERDRKANSYAMDRRHPPTERAAMFFREITGAEGLEFVLFVNSKMPNPKYLPGGIIIYPCFLGDLNGTNLADPLAHASGKMGEKGRYVYDGWLPINDWSSDGIKDATVRLERVLALLNLECGAYISWEPKYIGTLNLKPYFYYDGYHICDLNKIYTKIDKLRVKDRDVLYRSIGWLMESVQNNNPISKILFAVLCIESLATHINSSKLSSESQLKSLSVCKGTRGERRREKENCINTILEEKNVGLIKKIDNAYFGCVQGIQKRVRAQIEAILGADSDAIKILFEKDENGASLYDVRNLIAHGGFDALDEIQRENVYKKCYSAETVARQLLIETIRAIFGRSHFQASACASDGGHGLYSEICEKEEDYIYEQMMAVFYT